MLGDISKHVEIKFNSFGIRFFCIDLPAAWPEVSTPPEAQEPRRRYIFATRHRA